MGHLSSFQPLFILSIHISIHTSIDMLICTIEIVNIYFKAFVKNIGFHSY